MNLTECKNLDWGAESAEFVKISQENLLELRQHLLLAQKNAALSANSIEGLLQQLDRLEGSLQGLAAN